MIIDTLTFAGILASAFYLLTFAWFGRETLKVEEDSAVAGPGRVAPIERPCVDC